MNKPLTKDDALTPEVIAALAELGAVSRDPLAFQAGRLIGALDHYKGVVTQHGVGSPQSAEALRSYSLVVELYAPSLVAGLARLAQGAA